MCVWFCGSLCVMCCMQARLESELAEAASSRAQAVDSAQQARSHRALPCHVLNFFELSMRRRFVHANFEQTLLCVVCVLLCSGSATSRSVCRSNATSCCRRITAVRVITHAYFLPANTPRRPPRPSLTKKIIFSLFSNRRGESFIVDRTQIDTATCAATARRIERGVEGQRTSVGPASVAGAETLHPPELLFLNCGQMTALARDPSSLVVVLCVV